MVFYLSKNRIKRREMDCLVETAEEKTTFWIFFIVFLQISDFCREITKLLFYRNSIIDITQIKMKTGV